MAPPPAFTGLPPAAGPPPAGPPPPAFTGLPSAEPVTAPPMAQYEVMAPGTPFEAGHQPPPPYDPGYQPPPQYDPGYQPYAPAENYPPPDPGQGRRWWVPALVAVVVLLAIGAIATVLLVDGDGDDTAGPDPTPTPTVTASPSRDSESPGPSPSASSSSAPPRLVTIDPSVTDSRAAGVADMFDNYFTSVNNRDVDQALTAYDPAGVINPNDAKQATDFRQAIATTTDSQVVLRSIGRPSSSRPGGVLDARVTFHSNQQPGYGPRERPNEPCTAWDVTYTLSQPAGGAYKILIGKAASTPC
jgi:hypothetical protein